MKCILLQENMCEFNLVKMLKYELKKENSVLKSTEKLKDDLYINLSDVQQLSRTYKHCLLGFEYVIVKFGKLF